MGLQTGLLTGFSSWLKTRDGKHHTQKLPWVYICHQDGFHRSALDASFWAQNTLDFCQKYSSCPHSITSNWSLPLVNCFLSTIWICPVLAKLSTALTPALISLFHCHNILSAWSLTWPPSVSSVRAIFLKSALTTALTNILQYSPILTEESSQIVKLHNQIYLAPPPENLIWGKMEGLPSESTFSTS